MTAIIDYGVGNLFSLQCSFRAVGAEAEVTGDPEKIRAADRIILPGVGAFGDAVEKLRERGLDRVVIDEAGRGKPLLGICLGMQLLFDRSFEYGAHTCLGRIPGEERPIPDGQKIPHIGWNALIFNKKSPLFKYIKDGDHTYFVHSYYAHCPDSYVSAYTEYGTRLTASVESGNVYGCQFHPEKSGDVGLNILRAFCEV